MNTRILDKLMCPDCKGQPQLAVFSDAIDTHQPPVPSLAQEEILTGALKCQGCGVVYPVISGVPRLLSGGIKRFPDFVKKHPRELTGLADANVLAEVTAESDGNDYDNIRKSFSQEWSIFDYDSDKTWGWTLEERKRVFLADVCLKPEDLKDKTMLDAGCGNGSMTAALSGFAMEIVGMDLNDGLGRAHTNRGKYAWQAVNNVQYVQGNLVTPPLNEAAFDLIYSSGVIHHTPSSKKTFASLVKLVKRNGRLYVWVYGKRGWPVRLFFWCGRGLKQWMSLKSVMWVCRTLAPVYKGVAELLHALGIMQFRNRNSREITLDLFDAFAPRYNHWHTEEEVRSWFEEFGFKNIHVSGVQKHGFGMYGDKI